MTERFIFICLSNPFPNDCNFYHQSFDHFIKLLIKINSFLTTEQDISANESKIHVLVKFEDFVFWFLEALWKKIFNDQEFSFANSHNTVWLIASELISSFIKWQNQFSAYHQFSRQHKRFWKKVKVKHALTFSRAVNMKVRKSAWN